MAWAQNDANILTAGFASVKFKGVGDDAYYAVPFHGEGSFTLTPILAPPDNRLRQLGAKGALKAELKIRCHVTDTVLLLDNLVNYSRSEQILIKIDNMEGDYFYSEDIGATTGYFGCEWEYVVEGGYETTRYVEFTLTRWLTEAEFETCISSAQGDGTPNAADAFYHLSQMTIADMEPAALTTFEFREAASSSWDDSLGGNVEGFTFRAKMTGPMDKYGRVRGNRIDISFSLSSLQADEEIADLANYNKRANEVRFTFPADYMEFISSSTSGMLGVQFAYDHSGNIDRTSMIKIAGSGSILPSEWAACVADGTPP